MLTTNLIPAPLPILARVTIPPPESWKVLVDPNAPKLTLTKDFVSNEIHSPKRDQKVSILTKYTTLKPKKRELKTPDSQDPHLTLIYTKKNPDCQSLSLADDDWPVITLTAARLPQNRVKGRACPSESKDTEPSDRNPSNLAWSLTFKVRYPIPAASPTHSAPSYTLPLSLAAHGRIAELLEAYVSAISHAYQPEGSSDPIHQYDDGYERSRNRSPYHSTSRYQHDRYRRSDYHQSHRNELPEWVEVKIDGLKPFLACKYRSQNTVTRYHLLFDSYKPYRAPKTAVFMEGLARKLHYGLRNDTPWSEPLEVFARCIQLLLRCLRQMKLLELLSQEKSSTKPKGHNGDANDGNRPQQTADSEDSDESDFGAWYMFRIWGKDLTTMFLDPLLQSLHYTGPIPTKLSEFDSYASLKQQLTDREVYLLKQFVLFALRVRKTTSEYISTPSDRECQSTLCWFADVDVECLTDPPKPQLSDPTEQSLGEYCSVLKKLLDKDLACFRKIFTSNLGKLVSYAKVDGPGFSDEAFSGKYVQQLHAVMRQLHAEHTALQRASRSCVIRDLGGKLLPVPSLEPGYAVLSAFVLNQSLQILAAAEDAGDPAPALLASVEQGKIIRRIALWSADTPNKSQSPFGLHFSKNCIQVGYSMLENDVFASWRYDKASGGIQLLRVCGLSASSSLETTTTRAIEGIATDDGETEKSGIDSTNVSDEKSPIQEETAADSCKISRYEFDLGLVAPSGDTYCLHQVVCGNTGLAFLFRRYRRSVAELDVRVFVIRVLHEGELSIPKEVDVQHVWTHLCSKSRLDYDGRRHMGLFGDFNPEAGVCIRKRGIVLLAGLSGTIEGENLRMRAMLCKFHTRRNDLAYYHIWCVSLKFLLKKNLENYKNYKLHDLDLKKDKLSMILVSWATSDSRRCVLAITESKISVIPVNGRLSHSLRPDIGDLVPQSAPDGQPTPKYYLSKPDLSSTYTMIRLKYGLI